MLGIVIKKELMRVFTDRRLVFSAFILPALSIFIMYSLMGNMLGGMLSDIETHKSQVYIENMPESFKTYVMSLGEELNIDLYFEGKQIESAKEELKTGELDLILQFEENFDESVSGYLEETMLPEIMTFFNPSEDYSRAARSEVLYGLLDGYESQLLQERFGDIRHTKAFGIDITNQNAVIQDEAKATGVGLSMIVPMLLSIILFAGAMGIGMDTIAGEKERGTMATLLLAPVKRETIAYGKVISLGIVAVISAICSFIAIIASMPYAGEMLTGSGNVNIAALTFSPLQYLQWIVTLIVMVGIFVGFICLLSVHARSVKEAGTYVTPIYMLVMVSAFSTMFTTGEVALPYFALPIYSNIMCIKYLLTFELTMNQFLLSTGVSAIVVLILVQLITRAFNSEKTMFNA